MLQGLVQGVDILVLVIGEPGSGKTTLLHRCLATVRGQWKAVRIRADADTTAPRTTDLPDPGGYPAYILQDSENAVLFVDDCHKLPQKELEFLLQETLAPGSTPKIKKLILFGESELYTRVTRLAKTYPAHPAVNKIHLRGLTPAQTGAYLRHRLAAAGYSGKNLFNASAVKDIHQTSGGSPGAVNEAADRWLRANYATKGKGHGMLQHFSAFPRRTALWMAAGFVILLPAVLWYFQDRPPAVSTPSDQKTAKIVLRRKMPQDQQAANTAIRKKIAEPESASHWPSEVPAPQLPAVLPSTESPAEAGALQPATSELPAEAPAEAGTSQPIVVEPPAESSAEPETPQTAAVEFTTRPAAEIAPKQPFKTETAPWEPVAAAPADEALPEKIQIQPPPPHAPAASTANSVQNTVEREKWLLSQDATAYTIQIMGVHNEQSLMDFIKKNQLLGQNQIAYYESSFQGKAWFQLLYGIYPTKQAAELAADKLPENIRRAGPWIRRMSAVHQAIKNRGLQ